ncbi:unnamed protein product [Dovyalis caffra]|uniref:Uncharacterized protein n=1 Tax=Dovyalis caffra TaxID=77055 RepID=A0AAV1R1Z2_9ROSI|nr:unnamed protein product [Dovyalis caffra]
MRDLSKLEKRWEAVAYKFGFARTLEAPPYISYSGSSSTWSAREESRNRVFSKWAKIMEVSWEKDTNLWQFEEKVRDYLTSIPTRASDLYGRGGLSRS